MRETGKTTKQLTEKLAESRRIIAGLKEIESRYRRTESALRESEQRLMLFIENAPAAIAMLDRDMRYIAVSRRWLTDYGLGDRDIIGKSHYEVFPEIPQKWKDIHRRALSGEAARCEEDPFSRMDGRIDWVRWEVLPWHESAGTIGGIIMLTEVITERKEMEDELLNYRDLLESQVRKRTTELEERNRNLAEEIAERKKAEEERRIIESRLFQAQRIEALDRFAGGIAHDLNNILYPIIIDTELLLAEEQPGSPRFEILEQILKAANRQRDLVKKILSFSRQSDQNMRPIPVAPLIRETIGFLVSSLPSTIEIRERIDADSVVMGDNMQLQQVVMNLIQNASDSLPAQKGTIEIGLAKTRLDPSRFSGEIQGGDYVELSVRDSGIGMPPEVQDHIFEPFYTTKGVGKGTGLGLSIALGIVKSMGGAVTVESSPGKGTLFTVYLPVYTGRAGVQEAPADIGVRPSPQQTILLIDDEESVLISLKRVLNVSGYRVIAVRDSIEALRLLDRDPSGFDLVITDLTMPKMNGLELARKIHDGHPGVPVILSTGYGEAVDEREAESLGIRELLPKPADVRELRNTVHRALHH